MAGAGYKLFNTGDVLTAAQVNTYLQEQTVMVFASSAARTSALSGVLAEGMVSYLQDTNAVEVYNGSAWVGVSGAGDVTEVQAGTGISVASGTGPIPVVTNTMATEITAKGDLIVGTGSGTFDNLPAGTNGYTLVADSSVSPTGLKWAAPAGGGKVLQVVNATYSTLTTVTSTSMTDTGLTASITPTSATSKILAIITLPIYILQGSPATDAYGAWQLVRGATAINGMLLIGNTGSAASPVIDLTSHWYDSPATTSSTTYKVQIAAFAAGVSIQAQYKYTSFGNSSITLLEIGA